MGRSPNALVKEGELASWPLMFFFEKDDAALEKYSEGFDIGGAVVAERLCRMIEHGGSETETSLPLGQRCVLRLARDWDTPHSGLPAEQIPTIRNWIVRAFASLLDPADRSYNFLTRFTVQYAAGGPVARNHANERIEDARVGWKRFTGLLGDLGMPASSHKAIAELSELQRRLKSLWEQFPYGPSLRLGENCARRGKEVQSNLETLAELRTFTKDDVLRDVVDDSMEQLAAECNFLEADQQELLKQGILRCLACDVALKLPDLHLLERSHEKLRRFQAVAVERVVRVLDYLTHASEEQIRLVAEHCYRINVEEGELVRAVIEKGLHRVSDQDRARFEGSQSSGAKLLSTIEATPFKNPYRLES